jgi:tetratricopeptide (TPR) repeat protein
MAPFFSSRTKRALHTLSALSLALALAPAIAHADVPNVDSVAEARQRFRRGVVLYEEDDFRAALIEFNRAYQLAPNPAVLYNVGQSYYQLRDYAGALTTLERYLRESGDHIDRDRRIQVEREVQDLRGRVAHVTLRSNVDGAEFALDDVPIEHPFRDPVLVGAGRHRLSAAKRGYLTAARVIDVAGGDKIEVRLDLTPEARDARDARPARESPSYVAPAIAATFGVAGIAVGAVFGVQAMSNKSSLDGECNSSKVCPSSARSEVDAFSRNTTISTIAFSAGAVGLLAAGYFFFRVRASDAPSQNGSSVTASFGLGTATVEGTF